jgi:hypothetical protein
MPGSVTISEAQGAPVIPASADFAVCVVGCSTTSPLASGLMSAAYSSAATAASDYGLGDGIDCLTQAITPTQGNPAPPPACFYRTPATTTGSRGATLTTSIRLVSPVRHLIKFLNSQTQKIPPNRPHAL